MKRCQNCNNIIRKEDIYCRTCGIKIEKEINYIFLNIIKVTIILAIIFVILIFIASFLV